MMDAVFNLLFMANGRYYSYKTPFNFQSRNDPRIEDVQLLSDDGQSSNPTDSTFEPDKMEICEDRDRSAETPETPVAGHGGSGGEDQSSIFDRKGKRKMKDMEILQEPRAPWGRKMKYGCSSCNKSFHTHQALGGHMASHKKEKQVLDGGGGGGEAEKPASVEEQPVLPTVSGVKKAAMAEHRCDKCGVAFPTGQALGGHKRKHWNGHESSIFSNEAQEISSEIRSRLRLGRSSAVAPSQKDSSEKGEGGELYRSWPAAVRDENGKTAAPPGVIDFDLNEQPIEEGES
ncbi:unnamed protein product [Spirodela intermedia]|uniref:C2H2-type domain-containing protein n=1 Tax=Spirodela intermedia TaxID=51605 RepID=A0A7I8JMH4_SPIIN|nr:unnamed protein product [Spirodela intermedia]CAA6670783.1 unnamed protein product [Spirodela intermedia]